LIASARHEQAGSVGSLFASVGFGVAESVGDALLVPSSEPTQDKRAAPGSATQGLPDSWRPQHTSDLQNPNLLADVWIEDSSPHEGGLGWHQSISVGNPNGTYTSYSFEMDVPFGGHVYEDDLHGGKIEADMYLHTTPEEDARVMDMLSAKIGVRDWYLLFGYNCRDWSQEQFNAIWSMGIGDFGPPVARDPANYHPWYPTFDTIFPSLALTTEKVHGD
jgi:hypothetical protein